MTGPRRCSARAWALGLVGALALVALGGCGGPRPYSRHAVRMNPRRLAPLQEAATRATDCASLQVGEVEADDGILYLHAEGCGMVMVLPCQQFSDGMRCARWPEEVSASAGGAS